MDSKIRAGFEKAGLERAEKHLFLCLGPDCCPRREGEFLWEYVKKRVKETGVRVMRTKADCFRICTEGPWLVVYPDGTWYSKVTPAKFERILQQHIIGGDPVIEWIAARNCLKPAPSCSQNGPELGQS